MSTLTLPGWLAAFFPARETTAPPKPPRPRSGPLLMGDILTARLDQPDFLRHWDDTDDDAP